MPQPTNPPQTYEGWSCSECHTIATPARRGGPAGRRTLCNACGLRLSKRIKAINARARKAASPLAKSSKRDNTKPRKQNRKPPPVEQRPPSGTIDVPSQPPPTPMQQACRNVIGQAVLKGEESVVEIHRRLLETHGAAQAAQGAMGKYDMGVTAAREGEIAECTKEEMEEMEEMEREELFVEEELFEGGNACVPSMKEIEQAAREAGESCILAALDAVGSQLRERVSGVICEEEVGTIESSVTGGSVSTGMDTGRGGESGMAALVRLGQLEKADPEAIRAQAPRLMEEITEAVAGHRRSLGQLEQAAGVLEERTRVVLKEMASRRQAIGSLLNDVGRFKFLLRGEK